MNQRTLGIPGTLKHTGEQSDASLQEKAREHVERHSGLLFLADVMAALHASPEPMRGAAAFFGAFTPKVVMDAFAERPDLRVRTLKAITGGPTTLLRRLSTEAVASQIDLLAADDLPEAERSVRAEADRSLSVHELYLKYVDPLDIATYLPARTIWSYETQDDWWRREPTAATRALMATELRSIRRHAIMTDSEILDVLGDETFERHLSLSVRTGLRAAARRAAAEGRPFTDSELFSGVGGSNGGRDLIDEMVESIPLVALREVIDQVGRMLGMAGQDAITGPTKVAASSDLTIPTQASASRVGPKGAAAASGRPSFATAKAGPGPGLAERRPPAPPKARAAASKADPALPPGADTEGLPQPDDEFTFVEEVSGQV